MNAEQPDVEPFDPADNRADTADEFEDDDRDEHQLEDDAPALPSLVGGAVRD
jgi:hypothetical protein